MDIREKKCYSKVVFGEADEIPLEISESSCRRRRPYNFDYSVDYANMPSSSKVQRIFGDGFEQDQMFLENELGLSGVETVEVVDDDNDYYTPRCDYDAIDDNEHNQLIFMDQFSNDYLFCDLCFNRPLFTDRDALNSHCYIVHGNIVGNAFACPELECEMVFASIGAVKRHLMLNHNLPLETHYKKFQNIVDFNEWILFVQYTTGSRFVMHNRQQPKRRQLLFCAYSDHRKNNSKPTGMLKQKGCCPAHINYSLSSDGTVDIIYQMFHHGHADKNVDELQSKMWSLPKANRDGRSRIVFPSKPLIIGNRPMQYIRVDIIAMPESLYRQGATKYTSVLVVTDLFSKFMFAHALVETGVAEKERLIVRLLTNIFGMFGLPEGYSTIFGEEVINNCMCQIGHNFCIDIKPVSTTIPCYTALKKNIELRTEADLQDAHRWPEALPSVIMEQNQRPHAVFQYRITPFEMMFGRRAWYKTDPDDDLPWLSKNDDYIVNKDEICAKPPIRRHESNLPIFDSDGKPLEDTLKSKILRLISVVECRCERWDDQALMGAEIENSDVYQRFAVRQAFLPDDYVYVRTLNVPCEKGGQLKGLVSETCWDAGNHFTYRVHVRSGKLSELGEFGEFDNNEWPSPEDRSFWVSPYDVCARSIEQHIKRQLQFGIDYDSLYCGCSESCALFRSSNCANRMSKACCEHSGKKCVYHQYYDPRTVPLDRYAENYSQDPEKVLKKIAQKYGQRSTTTTDPGVGPEDKEDCNSPASLTAVSLGKMDRANEYVKNCSNSTKQIAVGNSCSEESIAYEKLTMIERELEDMEVTLSVMREKQRGQTLSEDYIMLESKAHSLRRSRDNMKKEVETNDKQKKLYYLMEASLPPSGQDVCRTSRVGTPNVRNSSEFEEARSTRVLIEDNQVFLSVEAIKKAEESPSIKHTRGILCRRGPKTKVRNNY